MLKRIIAPLLLLVACAAQAVTIDFEGLAAGSSPGDRYEAQGITFQGGTIAYNQFGAYLAGPTTMLVDYRRVGRGISLLADAMDGDNPSLVCGLSFCESVMIPTTKIPNGVSNPRRFDDGTLFGSVIRDDFGGIFRIDFRTTALDNISLDTLARPADRFERGIPVATATAEVPEPSTLLLAGLGFIFALWHCKRHLKVVDQHA